MGIVEARGLGKTYSDGTVALRDVDLEVPNESIFVVLGENGAGKTTFLNIASTLVRPSTGTVRIMDHDVVSDTKEVRRRIAVVPQDANPMGFMTPEEFVKLYLVSRGLSRAEASQRAQAAIDDLGLQEHRHKVIDTLSGGLRRRVLLAAVLASDAELVFLDEPTSGLDPVARRSFWSKLLLRKKQGRSMILNTHYPDEAEAIGDYVGILHEGRLAFQGSVEKARAEIGFSHKVVLERGVEPVGPLLNFLRSEAPRGKILCDETFVTVLTDISGAEDIAHNILARRRETVRVMPSTLEDLFMMKVRH